MPDSPTPAQSQVEQNQYSFSRQLFRIRNLRLSSYMRIPLVRLSNGTHFAMSCYPMLILEYDDASIRDMPFAQRSRECSFRINMRNQYRCVRFFANAINWFNDPEYQDLFLIDEETGRRLINMDYRALRELIPPTRYDTQGLLVVPAVVTIENSPTMEGVALSINNTKYTVMLTYDELIEIAGAVNFFSFQDEANLLINMALHGARTTDPLPGERRGTYAKTKIDWLSGPTTKPQ